MNKNSEKYQDALSYFGQEQLSKFESEIEAHYKKQKTPTWKWLTKKSNLWKTYSFLATALIGFQLYAEIAERSNKRQSPLVARETSSNSLLEVSGTFHLPELNVSLLAKPTDIFIAEQEEVQQLEVKKGDTLSKIAERLLVQNNLKNTHKNRQRLIQELKSINVHIEKSDFIKAGWQLKAIDSETIKNLIVKL